MRKIVGVTVGTPISPEAINDKLKPVKTVNGAKPDENGDVKVNMDSIDKDINDLKNRVSNLENIPNANGVSF